MPNILRLDMPRAGDDRRWLLGLMVASDFSDVAAALIGVRGRGIESRVDIVGHLAAPLALSGLATSGTSAAPAESLPELRAILAEAEAAVANELAARMGIAAARILAVGVHDPGVWQSARGGGPRGYLSLCDAARLAELTGLNVIDAFPARDIVQGGQGGPIMPLPQWLLLREPRRGRVLLDLGRTVRVTYVPAGLGSAAAARITAFDVGPGMSLLDQLAQRLSGGQHAFDPGGRMAVQGRRVGELIEHWFRDPYFDRPLPRWHPQGVRPERFLTDAIRLAVEHGWSIRDLLCTATHFVAEMVGCAIERRLPQDGQIGDIVVAGGGQHNGLLLRELATRTAKPLVRLGDLLREAEAFEPACVAVLAMCHLDQVPANLPAATGAELPRLLGRLTPGAPQNWQRLLVHSAEATPAVRPLRSAL